MQLFAHFGKLDRLRIILRGKGCRELPVQERIQGCYAHQSEAATSPAAHSAARDLPVGEWPIEFKLDHNSDVL